MARDLFEGTDVGGPVDLFSTEGISVEQSVTPQKPDTFAAMTGRSTDMQVDEMKRYAELSQQPIESSMVMPVGESDRRSSMRNLLPGMKEIYTKPLFAARPEQRKKGVIEGGLEFVTGVGENVANLATLLYALPASSYFHTTTMVERKAGLDVEAPTSYVELEKKIGETTEKLTYPVKTGFGKTLQYALMYPFEMLLAGADSGTDKLTRSLYDRPATEEEKAYVRVNTMFLALGAGKIASVAKNKVSTLLLDRALKKVSEGDVVEANKVAERLMQDEGAKKLFDDITRSSDLDSYASKLEEHIDKAQDKAKIAAKDYSPLKDEEVTAMADRLMEQYSKIDQTDPTKAKVKAGKISHELDGLFAELDRRDVNVTDKRRLQGAMDEKYGIEGTLSRTLFDADKLSRTAREAVSNEPDPWMRDEGFRNQVRQQNAIRQRVMDELFKEEERASKVTKDVDDAYNRMLESSRMERRSVDDYMNSIKGAAYEIAEAARKANEFAETTGRELARKKIETEDAVKLIDIVTEARSNFDLLADKLAEMRRLYNIQSEAAKTAIQHTGMFELAKSVMKTDKAVERWADIVEKDRGKSAEKSANILKQINDAEKKAAEEKKTTPKKEPPAARSELEQSAEKPRKVRELAKDEEVIKLKEAYKRGDIDETELVNGLLKAGMSDTHLTKAVKRFFTKEAEIESPLKDIPDEITGPYYRGEISRPEMERRAAQAGYPIPAGRETVAPVSKGRELVPAAEEILPDEYGQEVLPHGFGAGEKPNRYVDAMLRESTEAKVHLMSDVVKAAQEAKRQFGIPTNPDEAANLAWVIREKLRTNIYGGGPDTALIKDMARLALYHMERGVRTAAEFAKELINNGIKVAAEKMREAWDVAQGSLKRAPTFYLMADRFAEKMPERMNVDSFLSKLKTAIPAEEYKWLDVEKWAKDKKEMGSDTIYKEEVESFLRQSNVLVEEKRLGEGPHPQRETGEVYLATEETRTRYANNSNLVTPGLTNHRELVFSFPKAEPFDPVDTVHYGDVTGGKVVGWARVGDKVGADGKKVLFVDESQRSPRYAEGEKIGWKTEESEARLKEFKALNNRINELEWEIGKPIRDLGYHAGGMEYNRLIRPLLQQHPEINELAAKARSLEDAIGKVSDLPFKEDTQKVIWKRILRYASENGYDKVEWITGEETAKRYNLSNVVDEIMYDLNKDTGLGELSGWKNGQREAVIRKVINDKELESYVGKDVASKLKQQHSEQENLLGNKYLTATVSGDDLAIKAKWPYELYDKMIPDMLRSYVKKWGGEVREQKTEYGQINLTTAQEINDFFMENQREVISGKNKDILIESWRKYAEKDKEAYAPGEIDKTINLMKQDPGGWLDQLADAYEYMYKRGEAEPIKVADIKFGSHEVTITPEMQFDILYKGQPQWGMPKAREMFVSEMEGGQLRTRLSKEGEFNPERWKGQEGHLEIDIGEVVKNAKELADEVKKGASDFMRRYKLTQLPQADVEKLAVHEKLERAAFARNFARVAGAFFPQADVMKAPELRKVYESGREATRKSESVNPLFFVAKQLDRHIPEELIKSGKLADWLEGRDLRSITEKGKEIVAKVRNVYDDTLAFYNKNRPEGFPEIKKLDNYFQHAWDGWQVYVEGIADPFTASDEAGAIKVARQLSDSINPETGQKYVVKSISPWMDVANRARQGKKMQYVENMIRLQTMNIEPGQKIPTEGQFKHFLKRAGETGYRKDITGFMQMYVGGMQRKLARDHLYAGIQSAMKEFKMDAKWQDFVREYIDMVLTKPDAGARMFGAVARLLTGKSAGDWTGMSIERRLLMAQYIWDMGVVMSSGVANGVQAAITASMVGPKIFNKAAIQAVKGLTGKDKALAAELESSGIKHEIPQGLDIAKGDWGMIPRIMMYHFTTVEAFNRASAYFVGKHIGEVEGKRLLKDMGVPETATVFKTTGAEFTKEFGHELNDMINFRAEGYNSPKITRSLGMKLAVPYSNFFLNYNNLNLKLLAAGYKDPAFMLPRVAAVVAVTTALGGAAASPIAWLMATGADKALQAWGGQTLDDVELDMGDTKIPVGKLVRSGIPASGGVDLSGSLALQPPKVFTDPMHANRYVAAAFEGAKAIYEWSKYDQPSTETWNKLRQAVSPRIAEKMWHGAEVAQTGEYTSPTTGFKITDVPKEEAAFLPLGFQPPSVVKVQRTLQKQYEVWNWYREGVMEDINRMAKADHDGRYADADAIRKKLEGQMDELMKKEVRAKAGSEHQATLQAKEMLLQSALTKPQLHLNAMKRLEIGKLERVNAKVLRELGNILMEKP